MKTGGDNEADLFLRLKTRHSATASRAASFHPQLCCCRPVNYQYLISVLIFGIINVLLHNYILRTNEWISSNTYLQFSIDNAPCQSAPVSCCVLFGKYSFDMVAQTFWRLSGFSSELGLIMGFGDILTGETYFKYFLHFFCFYFD